ncbi:MAG: DUF4910 domain-containing protein [Deltaproteobacteria bacterium]
MKELISKMWKLNRAIVSRGYDKALEYIKKEINITVLKYESGKEFLTWKIPKKWDVGEAYVIDLDTGEKVIDIQNNILHVVVGSLPFEAEINKDKLMRHVHYDKRRPEYIPCVYKYYDQLDWGFCCNKEQYERLQKGERYKVVIKSSYSDGELKIGEYTVKGKTPYTVYILCHLDGPGQANDNLSGVAVSIEIAKKLSAMNPYYTYKFLYLPGTIGPMAYLASNPGMINEAIGAVVLEMLGNDRELTLQYSCEEDEYLDRIIYNVLAQSGKPFSERPFNKIFYSGERVFNSPGVDIPTCSLSRVDNKNDVLPFYEYRTSGDTPEKISEENLQEALETVMKVIDILEKDFIPIRNYIGIPFLSKYGLWTEWKDNPAHRIMINSILFKLDNATSVFEIADELSLDFKDVYKIVDKMVEISLLNKKTVY